MEQLGLHHSPGAAPGDWLAFSFEEIQRKTCVSQSFYVYLPAHFFKNVLTEKSEQLTNCTLSPVLSGDKLQQCKAFWCKTTELSWLRLDKNKWLENNSPLCLVCHGRTNLLPQSCSPSSNFQWLWGCNYLTLTMLNPQRKVRLSLTSEAWISSCFFLCCKVSVCCISNMPSSFTCTRQPFSSWTVCATLRKGGIAAPSTFPQRYPSDPKHSTWCKADRHFHHPPPAKCNIQ